MATILQAMSGEDLERARELFDEYARAVDEPCCFVDFEKELAALPGEYAPPAGRLFLARADGAPAGCAALRRRDAVQGEMKRLYVRPAFRGQSLGRTLADAVIGAAREEGYARLLLDTLPTMSTAIALYRTIGFREIAPYSSTPGAICFELVL
jgi:putative acetyltransferase